MQRNSGRSARPAYCFPSRRNRRQCSPEAFQQVLARAGLPNSTALTIRGSADILDLPEEIARGQAIPAIVVEVHTTGDKVAAYKPDQRFAELSDWFVGLG